MRETHLRKGRQTVKLGLIKVVHDLFPDERLQTFYSILEGVYCSLYQSPLSIREVRLIEERLRAWAASRAQIRFLRREDGYYVYQVDGLQVRAVYPAFQDTSLIEPFTIVPFSPGFIVDFGDIDRGAATPLIPPFLLSQTYERTRRWLDNVDIEHVADLNAYISSGRALQLITIAEALHEKQIAEIADTILQQRRALRVLLVSGPSSSGKTSFTQRISTQLVVNGLRPVPLSLDDYFVNRADTPRDENGDLDFERLDALDLPLLHAHIRALIEGETVDVPSFDFVTGTRTGRTTPLGVGPSQILLIEGIHALNPALLDRLHSNIAFRIYVSALGGVNIDLMNRVPTTEIRLVRRMVRDHMTRGISPEETLARWASVRRGEYANVFRFQEQADVMFNTSMLYELNALRVPAERALASIRDDSPYRETRDRLGTLLSFFEPIDVSKVPFNSILREFIGGSIYFEP